MKKAIEGFLSRNVSSEHETKVLGTKSYYQVFIEVGVCINMESFRHAIEHATDEIINIDTTCVIDREDDKYKLLIEVYF